MTSSIPNSDAFNWIIVPAGQCVRTVAEETRIASLLQRAVVTLESQGPLLDLAQQQLSKARLPTRAISELRQQQKGLAKEAAEIRREDFASINRSSLIGLWVAIEVAVEDTVVLILSKDSNGIALTVTAGVKTTGF